MKKKKMMMIKGNVKEGGANYAQHASHARAQTHTRAHTLGRILDFIKLQRKKFEKKKNVFQKILKTNILKNLP